jgi:uncharacterized glyoxalase superfamily protein PhnB
VKSSIQIKDLTMQTLYPCLFYNDAPAAIEWLNKAFGFTTNLSVPGENPNEIAHAELSLNGAVIMMGTAKNTEFPWKSPMDIPAVNQMLYVVIDNVDEHCEQARAAGAKIVREPKDEDYGGRDYMAVDPEGNYWSFGTYQPKI